MFNVEGQQIINESGSGYAVDAGDFRGLSQKAIFVKDLNNAQRIQMEKSSRNYYETHFSKEQLFDFLEKDFSH